MGRRIIYTYVKRNEPAPNNTRPSNKIKTTNRFNIFDVVKIKGESDTYKVFAIQYYHNKGIVYELWRINDLLEKEVEEELLEKV